MTKATYTQRERKQGSTLDIMPLILRFNIGIEPYELLQYLLLVGKDRADGLHFYLKSIYHLSKIILIKVE